MLTEDMSEAPGMIFRTLTTMCLCLGLACGGTEPTSETPEQSDACEGLHLGDPCITEHNFAQCQARAAECPGEVLQLESCPLQFACPPQPPG